MLAQLIAVALTQPPPTPQVRISGLSVALGYYRLPELSAQTFKQPLGPSAATPKLPNSKAPSGGIDTAGGDQAAHPACYLSTGDLGFLWERRLYIVGAQRIDSPARHTRRGRADAPHGGRTSVPCWLEWGAGAGLATSGGVQGMG